MRVLTFAACLPIVALLMFCGVSPAARGQNVYQDYRVNPTGPYSPQDPWQKGRVFRTHTGHDGLFYNCDGEEDKRCSPWIRWGQRPCDDLLAPSRIRAEYQESLCDALERLRSGSCQNACGLTQGTGYPPGAGYGNEPLSSVDTSPNLRPNDDTAPAGLGLPTDSNQDVAPPEPQPVSGVGQSEYRRNKTSIVDLPSINHLRPTPR
ncbi:MAG: hypothetical protein JNL67_11465 [Planctomycetaceae bacterium]|nr:hypothetical protein [Planctomycetaceae bacterium]